MEGGGNTQHFSHPGSGRDNLRSSDSFGDPQSVEVGQVQQSHELWRRRRRSNLWLQLQSKGPGGLGAKIINACWKNR